MDLASLVDAGYKVPQLLDMAFAEERSLTDEDVGDAGVHLDNFLNSETRPY